MKLRILSFVITVALVFSTLPIVPAQAVEENENVLSYNDSKVAQLVCKGFEATRLDDGTVNVVVAADVHSRLAMVTGLPYLAFADTGTKHEEGSAHIDDIVIGDETETIVIAFRSASEEDGVIVFTGDDVPLDELDEVLFSAGPVGGTIDEASLSEALEAMGKQLESSSEDVEASVVDLPSLDGESARSWVEALSGSSLEMTLLREGEVHEDDVLDMTVDGSSYIGYFPDSRPMGSPDDDKVYADFSSDEFKGRWAVDGDGFLWFVDEKGRQYCHTGATFYTFGEVAANENAVSELSAVDEGIALASDMTIADGDRALAVKLGGIAATIYISLDVNEVEFDVGEMELSCDYNMVTRMSASYSSHKATKMYKNLCLNPKVPLELHVGPVYADVYVSLGAELSVSKLSLSSYHAEKGTAVVKLTERKVEYQASKSVDEQPSVSYGFSGKLKAFATIDAGVGSRVAGLSIASADICPFALGVEASGEPLTGCADLDISISGEAAVPSVYDKVDTLSSDRAPDDPAISSMLAKALGGGQQFAVELYNHPLVSLHMEKGKRIAECTNSNRYPIAGSKISASVSQSVCIAPGVSSDPKISIKDVRTGSTLEEGVDYEASFSKNGRVGPAVCTLRGTGSYRGVKNVEYKVCKPANDDCYAYADIDSFEYTGAARTIATPGFSIRIKGKDLSNLGVSLSKNFNTSALILGAEPGSYAFTVSGQAGTLYENINEKVYVSVDEPDMPTIKPKYLSATTTSITMGYGGVRDSSKSLPSGAKYRLLWCREAELSNVWNGSESHRGLYLEGMKATASAPVSQNITISGLLPGESYVIYAESVLTVGGVTYASGNWSSYYTVTAKWPSWDIAFVEKMTSATVTATLDKAYSGYSIRMRYSTSKSTVEDGKGTATAWSTAKKVNALKAVTKPNTKYYYVFDYKNSAGTSESTDEPGYFTTMGWPGFSWGMKTATTSTAKIAIKLTSVPAQSIKRVRVSYGKTKANATGWKKNVVSKDATLKVKGDVAYVTLSGLAKDTKYYFCGGLGVKDANGKWYYRNGSDAGYFWTKSS